MPKHKFLQKYYSNQVRNSLVRTTCAITSGLTNPPAKATALGGRNKSIVDSLDLDADEIDEYEDGTLAPPDVWQQACLLAFYGFHQEPGRHAAARIDRLARQAYRQGLHRLDDDCLSTLGSANNHSAFDDDDREEWRYIWWTIFILDSYASITMAFRRLSTSRVSTQRCYPRRCQPRSTTPTKFFGDLGKGRSGWLSKPSWPGVATLSRTCTSSLRCSFVRRRLGTACGRKHHQTNAVNGCKRSTAI